MPLAGSEEWARTLPAAKLLVVPEAGHYPHAELGGALLSCRRALPKRFLGETLPGSYQQPGGLTMFNAVRSLAHPFAPELVKLGGCGVTEKYFGVWRSPVARLLWEQEVPGSNPGAPMV